MPKKSYIFVFSILLIVGITSTTINSKAHAPMHLNLSYDEDSNIFTISFIHGVTDPSYHYVKSISINVTNHITHNSTIYNYYYTSQPSTNIFTYEYDGIIANENDRIDVIAECSLHGSAIKTIEKLGHPRHEHKDTFASTIAPSLISIALVIGIIMLPRFSRKKELKIKK